MSSEDVAAQFLEVDFGVLAELDDNEAALELVDMYDEETNSVIQQLEAYTRLTESAQTAQAWSSIWAFLHKLKGSSLSIGLVGVAAFIESLRSSDISTLHEWYPKVFEQLKSAVVQSVDKIKSNLE
ncbi:hypothetical protein KFE25_008573 [Diacronema lutheri]|uniref:HPt domain-containing protein n=1 Tax=Diacronema lutheri TaxID=2081491 RepID=A0A8J6CCR4_DIALT|nr:hypothetical protein KFE25_008573 [Diacronema lutheri]